MDPAQLGPAQRSADLEAIQKQAFDLVVIGGGVVGAGTALDAASRGLSVALIEQPVSIRNNPDTSNSSPGTPSPTPPMAVMLQPFFNTRLGATIFEVFNAIPSKTSGFVWLKLASHAIEYSSRLLPVKTVPSRSLTVVVPSCFKEVPPGSKICTWNMSGSS